MAVGFEETLQTKLNEIVASVQQEEKRLKAIEADLESKRAQLEGERAAFEVEKDMIASANKALNSKVTLDVGGTTYHASRTTLTSVPGSMLEAMFSGRHKLEEDEDGRVFIDRDGASFKLVLEYLRSPVLFSLHGLSEREVASCNAELDYYGQRPPVPPAPLCLRTNTDPSGRVSAQPQGDNCCTIPRDTCFAGWAWAVGADVLADDAVWKLHVHHISGSLMMGVIANPAPSGEAFRDATFAGWHTHPNRFYARGGFDRGSPGWPGWQEDDEAIFRLNAPARRLTVHLKRTGQCYMFLDLPAGECGHWRFCIDTYYSATVILSRPTDDEHALVQ